MSAFSPIRRRHAGAALIEIFPVGTYVWYATKAGRWLFVAWGPGGEAQISIPAASGAYGEVSAKLPVNAPVNVQVGSAFDLHPRHTVITLSNRVCTAGSATADVPGVASGFDYQLDGSLPGVDGQGNYGGAAYSPTEGAGAPGRYPFRGSAGGLQPGHGAGTVWIAGQSPFGIERGPNGLVVAVYQGG